MTNQPASIEPSTSIPREQNRALVLIGALRLVEGLLVLAMAIGVLKLLHHDVAALAADWIAAMRIDPHNEHIHSMLAMLGLLDDHRLRQISAGSFVYAALKLTEGGGLLFEKRWAEYLTVIATGVMIPLEIHELINHASWPRAVVFVANAMVVWYLAINLRRTRNDAPSRQ
jgi:uncharacterized membrane protein (DUF2068 family)